MALKQDCTKAEAGKWINSINALKLKEDKELGKLS
jgi:hypothetical protein